MDIEPANERLARLEEKYKASEAAISTTKMELDRRLSEMNNFREQINIERNKFVSRDLFDREHEALKMRVGALENSKAGALGTIGAYGGIITFLLAAGALLIAFFKH